MKETDIDSLFKKGTVVSVVLILSIFAVTLYHLYTSEHWENDPAEMDSYIVLDLENGTVNLTIEEDGWYRFILEGDERPDLIRILIDNELKYESVEDSSKNWSFDVNGTDYEVFFLKELHCQDIITVVVIGNCTISMVNEEIYRSDLMNAPFSYFFMAVPFLMILFVSGVLNIDYSRRRYRKYVRRKDRAYMRNVYFNKWRSGQKIVLIILFISFFSGILMIFTSITLLIFGQFESIFFIIPGFSISFLSFLIFAIYISIGKDLDVPNVPHIDDIVYLICQSCSKHVLIKMKDHEKFSY